MLPVYLIHHHAPEWVSASIRSIERSTIPVAVTVVDNGGAPDLGVRVLRQPENRGYTGGANAALRDWPTDSEWVVIGAHDLQVVPHTFARMLEETADPTVGIVGPTLATGSQGRKRDGEYEWLSGTCLMIRRACFETVGWFDERLGSYVEDVDYGLRARRAGWRIVRSDAWATGIGTAIARPAGRRLMRRNALYVEWKNGRFVRQLARNVSWIAGGIMRRQWDLARADALGLGDGVRLVTSSRRASRPAPTV